MILANKAKIAMKARRFVMENMANNIGTSMGLEGDNNKMRARLQVLYSKFPIFRSERVLDQTAAPWTK
jgi:hypothetical protein